VNPAFFMEKKWIDISVNVPYIKIGTISAETKKVWVIFHGYGQLAEEFSSQFSKLEAPDTCLIFPQGLSKFYLKGTDKKIGANWMTAHDREVDIENYISCLEKIYNREIRPFEAYIELNLLGFSQGVHTVSRWIYRSEIQYNKLLVWGADIAQEIDGNLVKKFFSCGKNIVIIGDRDRYIDEEKLKLLKARYSKIGFKYQLVEYNGGHDIYPDILIELV
jgi:predicted esterase